MLVANDEISLYALRDNPIGTQLFEVLKDGKRHALVVEVAADAHGDRMVRRLVQKNWRQLPEETGRAK